jgi:myo-inositol-1(or 4)-monophosphatase
VVLAQSEQAADSVQTLSVSKRSRFRDGLFATGFSAQDTELDQQLELLSRCISRSRGVRRAGAAALDLCWVAEGAFDVFWERHLQPWDTAAGALIAQEAGAVVTDLDGRVFNPRQSSIVAGNPILHRELLEIYRQIRRRP